MNHQNSLNTVATYIILSNIGQNDQLLLNQTEQSKQDDHNNHNTETIINDKNLKRKQYSSDKTYNQYYKLKKWIPRHVY